MIRRTGILRKWQRMVERSMKTKVLALLGSSVLVLVLFSCKMVLAHGGKTHDQRPKDANKKERADLSVKLEQVGKSYQQLVQPIFQKGCLECHGGNPNYPWYYKIPGIRQLVDSDVAEARKHLDISKGFPFKGHGSPKEDLEAIRDAIQEGTMPPFRYWVMHWNAKLSADEREVIYQWVEQSLKLLEESKTTGHQGH